MDKDSKTTIYGALAYLLVTFPLAVLWHLFIFGNTYDIIGYIDAEPNFLFGFLSILFQGLLLSYGYRFVKNYDPLKYAALIGVFFWTSHVLAFAAKGNLEMEPTFFFLETIYLTLQFGIYGLLLKQITKRVE